MAFNCVMTVISRHFIEFGSVGANYVKVVKAIDRYFCNGTVS